MRLKGTTAHRAQIAAATAAAAAEAEAEAEGAPVEWAQCEAVGCGKWRVLPAHVRAATLPKCFVCSMGHWLPGTPSCRVPADEPDEVAAVVVAHTTAAVSIENEFEERIKKFGYDNIKRAIYDEVPSILNLNKMSQYFNDLEYDIISLWEDRPQLYIIVSGEKK